MGKLIDNEYGWQDVKLMLGGIEISGLKGVTYKEEKKVSHPNQEFYYRRGNKYFFTNHQGASIAITTNDSFAKIFKRGDIYDIDFPETGNVTFKIKDLTNEKVYPADISFIVNQC